MIRSPLVCPISVGREAPLRQLVERLEWAAAGRGTVLLLGGDAGVGKSRTARELKREATLRGVRVIEGRCSSAESSVPYAPLMDVLRFRLSRGEGPAVAKMLGPLREILEPLFPQLKGGPRNYAQRTPEAFELIYRAFARLVADDPLLLILEDIHWADQTTLELLHQLTHRAGSLKILLVATYRTDELHSGHPLRRLLGVEPSKSIIHYEMVGKDRYIHDFHPQVRHRYRDSGDKIVRAKLVTRAGAEYLASDTVFVREFDTKSR